MRGCDIAGPNCHCSGDTERSRISVVLVAGFPPPKIMTRGLYPFDGFSGSRTDVP